MPLISRLVSLWRNLVHRDRVERDLDDEMRAVFDLLVDEKIDAGISPPAARRAARLEIGGVEAVKDQVRDARTGAALDTLAQDVRYAARMLRRNPIFALTAALSLAIGIGANTTIFTVAHALLFQAPVGVAEPGRLVDIGSTRYRVGFGNLSYPNYLDLRQRATTLDGVYAYSLFPRAMSLGGGGGAERVFGTHVTVNYFSVLGAVPAAGRLFDGSDSDQPGASPIAVLSHGFWMRRFDRDPGVVGRAVVINGRPCTVIGVASQGFHGTGGRAADVWLPMNMTAEAVSQDGSTFSNRGGAWLLVGGRLKPGVSRSQAAAEVDTIGRALASEYPDQNRGKGLIVTASSPVPGASAPVSLFLALLTAIVSIVLFIACANLGGVLLARATARRREIAVRLAMGAGRRRLVQQLLTETIMLVALGGAIGLALARSLTSLLVSTLPALPFPVDVSLALDWRAVLFTTGLVLVAALLSGLAPALQAAKADVVSSLKDDAQSSGRLRLRHGFVVAQVAFSLLLVVVAGLFVRELQAVGAADPGFDPHGVELAALDLSLAGYSEAAGLSFTRELVDRVRALPDVEQATLATFLPGGFETNRRALSVPGVTPPSGEAFFSVDWSVVDPGYFATLRIPLAAGRDFSPADRAGTPRVAIVGEGAARQFWPGQDPIGKYIVQQEFGPKGLVPAGAKPLQVVGVARDVKANSLIDGPSRSLVYVPLQQQYAPRFTIAARSTRGQRIADEIGILLLSLNPNLPIVAAQTLDDSVALGLVPQRLVVSVAGSLGLVGALLAAIGIYGVTAYAVSRRTREIGIRMALGAQRRDVVTMILRQGMALAVIGIAIGLALATVASQGLAVFLFGVRPLDPAIFGSAALLFVAIGLAACWVPVLRATRIESTEALRYE